MRFLLLLITCWGSASFAQSTYFHRDTTYSIPSAFRNIQQEYPKAQPVWAELPKGVQAHENLVYSEPQKGRKLHLDMFVPNKAKKRKLPTLLMIHGGGWIAGSKENLIPMAQQLAKKGYVTATVEYRLGGEAPYPASVLDLKASLRWLRAHAMEYGIDPDKIAAYGCSAGATLASLIGTTHGLPQFEGYSENTSFSSEVQAILNIDGVVSFVHPEAEAEWTGRAANTWLGSYEENLPRWEEASALEYVGEDTPPILFVNSSFPRFHAGRDDFIKKIKPYGTYHEVHTFEGSPHTFWLFDPWFKPTMQVSDRFLKKVFNKKP